MKIESPSLAIVQRGDLDGLGSVYTSSGELILAREESILARAQNWDINILSPWRKWLPRIVFEGFNEKADSSLYVTTHRIVLIREIDTWRELKGEFTALGLPSGTAAELLLRQKKAAGARQYCSVINSKLRVVSSKRYDSPRSLLYAKTIGTDNRQYAISAWKTDGTDHTVLNLLEERLGNPASGQERA